MEEGRANECGNLKGKTNGFSSRASRKKCSPAYTLISVPVKLLASRAI
jgi:hypothetical protein